MAHCEKFKATQISAVCKHDSRQQGDGVEHSNESIDNERTHLNYNLASKEQPISATKFIRERLSQCKVLKRADVNVMCGWAVTLPKDFTGNEQQFFEQSYKFLCERYGKENVVSAWVHMDENQPHLHFKFIPVTQGKDGTDKVSAKEVVNRSDLRSFHTDLQKHLENALQCHCNVLNGATDKANKTLQQAVEVQAKVSAMQQNILPLHQQAVVERDKAKKLRENEERLIEAKAQELSERKVNEVLGGIPSKERDRMRKFMDGLQFQDGSTALERFEKQEFELKKSVRRGLER